TARPELIQSLIDVVTDHAMPPEEQPPLPIKTREQFLSGLKILLKKSLKSQPFIATPIRRMNRFQYNNSVVDLLELDREIFRLNERLMRRRDDYFHPQTQKMPSQVRVSSRPLSKDIDNQRPEGFKGVAAFPQDQRAEFGFDNRADHITLSPLLMESFLKLSQTISESPDLNPKECRSWNRIFLAPEADPATATAQKTPEIEIIRKRLIPLLRRAFRKPVDKETLVRFTQFAEKQLLKGASFEQTMRTVIGAVIGMPDFLYFYEKQPPSPQLSKQIRQRVDDFELASRLSNFFWSSIPDDPLLDLAETGKLSDPQILVAQIQRMMNDRRSARFCDNFPSQWLQLDRLITSVPDPQKYPGFYHGDGYRASMHMIAEPLLLFETLYIEDRSIVELLNPKFTWESSMLRAIYSGHFKGGHEVVVQVFKRVPLTDPRRGGVITNAAVMTMTATPTRTQPITRGAWFNAVIFNDPPEPPPADVPVLPEVNPSEVKSLTIRERLAVHRKRKDCSGCHNKLDPLGFALENFGPTGFWRETYENGRQIDASGVLFNQFKFNNLVDFKQILVQQKHRFIRGFTAHLLSYALGRELGPADSPALETLTQQALNGKDSLRTLMQNIATSEPFLHKR
ncbi:MAG: DUF1592 domain-containing protein, partial [Planctomycetota bacterium]|nr:DUF1592 domain-containing protein [Planctomycetota bacterium]